MTTRVMVGLAYRAKVLNVLRRFLPGAYDPWESNRLSDTLKAAMTTDIGGVEPWSIDVRATRTLNLSGSLTEAKERARTLGTDWYVTIQPRRGYPATESYAVLPLHLFARLLSGEVPQLPDAPEERTQ